MCKGVHCVELDEIFRTGIYLQNLASIQARTSPVKFARPLAVHQPTAEIAAWGGTKQTSTIPKRVNSILRLVPDKFENDAF